jgi:hypothetical protein
MMAVQQHLLAVLVVVLPCLKGDVSVMCSKVVG